MEGANQCCLRTVYLCATARAPIGPLAVLPCGDVRKSAAGEVAKYRFSVRALRVGERQTDTGHGCWTSRPGKFQVGATAATLS